MGLIETLLMLQRWFYVVYGILCLSVIIRAASEPCEPRVLEENPPDPVRFILYFFHNYKTIKQNCRHSRDHIIQNKRGLLVF